MSRDVMTLRRVAQSRAAQVLFAGVIAVTSVQLERLIRAQKEASQVAPSQPASVAPAGAPRTVAAPTAKRDSNATTAAPVVATFDRSRFVPVGRTKTPIVSAVLAHSGTVAAVLEESGRVTVWDIDLHQRMGSFSSGHRKPSSDYTPPMELIAPVDLGVLWSPLFVTVAGSDGSVGMWRASPGKQIEKIFSGSSNPALPIVDLRHIFNTPDLVGVASDGSIVRWMSSQPDSAHVAARAHPGGAVYDLDSHRETGVSVAATAGGLYVIGGPIGFSSKLLDSSSAHPVKAVYSPNGTHIATAWSDGEIRVYSVATRERVRTMRLANTPPTLLAFNRDASLLAANAPGRGIHVWSMAADQPPLRVKGPRAPLRSMWFAPYDGSLVVAARGDRYLRRLEVPAGR